MAKYSVFPRVQAQARSSLSKRLLPSTESNIMVFQTLEGLQCDLPVRAFQRHPCVRLYGPCIQEDSTEVTTHTHTHTSRRTGSSHCQLDLLQSFISLSCLNQQLFSLLYKWLQYHTSMRHMFLPKYKEANQLLWIFLSGRKHQKQQLVLHFEKDVLTVSDQRNCTEVCGRQNNVLSKMPIS